MKPGTELVPLPQKSVFVPSETERAKPGAQTHSLRVKNIRLRTVGKQEWHSGRFLVDGAPRFRRRVTPRNFEGQGGP